MSRRLEPCLTLSILLLPTACSFSFAIAAIAIRMASWNIVTLNGPTPVGELADTVNDVPGGL